jgi:hypothetical protein
LIQSSLLRLKTDGPPQSPISDSLSQNRQCPMSGEQLGGRAFRAHLNSLGRRTGTEYCQRGCRNESANGYAARCMTLKKANRMSNLERFLEPGCTEMPTCRCGHQMAIRCTYSVPKKTATHVRVYKCAACHHELRLTVWGEDDLSAVALKTFSGLDCEEWHSKS